MRPYRFRTTWWLPIAEEKVFDAITDLASYPLWWPDVRAVRQLEDDVAELSCQALLPYELVVRMRREQQDKEAGKLRVALSGDLEGNLVGEIKSFDHSTCLVITQEVIASKTILRRLDFVARPLFRINHAVMMRRGRRHLISFLQDR